MFSTENVSAFLAVIITVGVFVLLAMGMAVPEFLTAGFGLVLGFFFGNQTGQLAARLK